MGRGDVVRVQLPGPANSPGHEQTGTRPALVVHSDTASGSGLVVMIIPFTSKLKAQRFAHTLVVQPSSSNGPTATSVLLVQQLRAIDTRRITTTLERLDHQTMAQVDAEMRRLLDL